MGDFNSEAAKVMAKINELGGSIPGRFTAATNAGFLSGIVKSASKQTSTISSNIGSVNRIAAQYTEDQFERDRKNADAIKEIEVTTDFYANNDTSTKQYNQVLLSKMDGTSVNEGQVTNSVDVHGDETDVDKEGIAKQGAVAGDEHDEQHTNVTNRAIDNINVAEDQGVEVDADSNVIREGLGNISGGESGETYAATDSNVNQQTMGSINDGAKTNNASGDKSADVTGQVLQSMATAGAATAAVNAYQKLLLKMMMMRRRKNKVQQLVL